MRGFNMELRKGTEGLRIPRPDELPRDTGTLRTGPLGSLQWFIHRYIPELYEAGTAIRQRM